MPTVDREPSGFEQLEIRVVPIYEYKCRKCDEHFEVEQSFTDDTLTEIDGCIVDDSGRHQVKKVFAAPAIAFKGDGFYRNDARSSGKPADKSSVEASSTKDSSTDSKPDSGPTKSDTSSSSDSSSSSTSTPGSSADKVKSSTPSTSSSTSD